MNFLSHTPDMIPLVKIPSNQHSDRGNQPFFSENVFGYQYDANSDGNT